MCVYLYFVWETQANEIHSLVNMLTIYEFELFTVLWINEMGTGHTPTHTHAKIVSENSWEYCSTMSSEKLSGDHEDKCDERQDDKMRIVHINCYSPYDRWRECAREKHHWIADTSFSPCIVLVSQACEFSHCGLLICKFRAARRRRNSCWEFMGKTTSHLCQQENYIFYVVYKLEKWVSLCEVWKDHIRSHIAIQIALAVLHADSLKLNGYDIKFKLKPFRSLTRTYTICIALAKLLDADTYRFPFTSPTLATNLEAHIGAHTWIFCTHTRRSSTSWWWQSC